MKDYDAIHDREDNRKLDLEFLTDDEIARRNVRRGISECDPDDWKREEEFEVLIAARNRRFDIED